MGVGDESTFLIKKLDRSGDKGKKVFYRDYSNEYKDGVELELEKYSLPCSRIHCTALGLFTVLLCSVRRFWPICLALFTSG